jgi:hypothetical protein
MKRWFARTAALVGMMCLPLCAQSGKEPDSSPGTSQPAGPHDDWLVFRDVTGGYQIQYPSDWHLDDKTAPDGLIRADIARDGSAGFQIRLQREVKTDFDSFVEAYISKFKQDMIDYWGGTMTEAGRSFGPLGDHEGFRLSLLMKRVDGQEWLFKQFLWPHEDAIIIIQAGVMLDLREEAEPILDAIAETFELTE